MLDVSRDRVPTMATLERLVELFASWKLNELQLYMEHTFAYAGHEDVWRGKDPFTPEEIRALDRTCADFGIELVPNQQCFGHLHRWLTLPQYRPLAECPDGVEHPFSASTEPFSLCPGDPGALVLLDDLFAQLLPCFRSPEVHVGLDETFDLGQGRSAERCATEGVGRVHVDFLRAIHERVRAHGKRMWFWADVLLHHPEVLPDLPPDVVACSWGYEAAHDFDDELGRLAAAGVNHVACPGTTSWKSFVGRPRNMLTNVENAARAAHRHGSLGLLMTDWGDSGHLQPLLVSGPGLLAAAACSWNADEIPHHDVADDEPVHPEDRDRLAERLDWWWIDDPVPGLGSALLTLGEFYRLATPRPHGKGPMNGSNLFHLFSWIDHDLTHSRFDHLCAEGLGRVARAATAIREGLSSRAEIYPADGPPELPPYRWTLAPSEATQADRLIDGDFVANVGVGTVWASVAQPAREPDPVAAQIAQRMKQLFDPTGRLNPGRTPGA